MDVRAASAPVAPSTGEDPELVWLRTTYRPGVAQLTVRAALTGMVIGGVMCLSNLYVVLKTGWSLGVTVTSCILAYAAFRLLEGIGVVRKHFTILENNAMGSVASAAGYMTGGGNMAALPALLLLTGSRPDGWWMFFWFATIAALGVFAAIPIKRSLINVEQLPFPTGIATAETLKSMHAGSAAGEDGGAGAAKARWLGWSAVAGTVIAFLRDAKAAWMPFNLPKSIHLPFGWGGHPADKWTMSVDGSFILVGVGAIMGLRTCASMLVGAIALYGFIAPRLLAEGIIAGTGYKAIVQWSLWPAAALLVSHGLLSFAFQWRSVARSFRSLLGGARKGDDDPMAEVECPAWWFPAGFVLLGPVVVFLMWKLFAIPVWAGLIALPLAVAMGVVASRVTGETDITPTKALGPATQMIYGAMLPNNLPANIMGANVTGGVGLHAADLLTDLKSGWLVGANPRQQFVAQLFGVVAGAAVVVPAFTLLIPDAKVLGSPEFPAPAVQVWAGVSQALVTGLAGMHPTVLVAVRVAGVLGVVLALVERFAPRHVARWIPSASGLGVALMVPGANAISMFIGAAIAAIVARKDAKLADRSVVSTASGLIAGESLMGILIAILVATGVLTK